jgi:lambda family phage portal protein
MKFSVKVGRQEISVNENLVDRAVRYFNPNRAQRRMQARLQMEAFAGGNSYTGASKSRRSMKEWQTTSNSADGDVLFDLPLLRERSRDLVRNAPLASGAINTVVTNVIGTGLSLQSRVNREVLGMTEEQAAEWQKNSEREFRMWSESPDCDITRTQNFYELQDLVFRGALESGDSFALLPHLKRPGDAYGLKVQLVEGDRVSNPNFARDKLGFAGGVELDDTGAPVAYHILKTHPGDLNVKSRQWDRILAFGEKTGRRNVLHLFKRVRPGQNRGVPYLAPVIDALKQIDRYTEAEIMAAVVSGMFTVFVHSEGQGLDPANQMGMAAETGARPSDTDIKMASGAIIDLGLNEKIETANPGRPNTAFDPFVMAILRQVGVALELPFEILVKHFTASYSAARAAMLEAWKFFRVRRDWIAGRFCQPIYEMFLAEAIASGRILAPGFFDDPLIRAAYCAAQWQGDGPGAIDPLKESLAVEKRLEIGLSTLAKETAAYDGSDWEDNHTQQVRENAMRLEGGLIATQPTPAAVAPAAAPEDTATEETDQPENADAKLLSEIERQAAPADVSGEIKQLRAEFEQLIRLVGQISAQHPPRKYVQHIERDQNNEIIRVTNTIVED